MQPSAERAYVQSAAQLRHIPRHQHGSDVLCVCRAPPHALPSRSAVTPSLERCLHRVVAHRPASQPAQLAPQPAMSALFATLDTHSTRRSSTSSLASTRPALRTRAGCSWCAPRRALPPHNLCSRTLSPSARRAHHVVALYTRGTEAAPVHAACAQVVPTQSFWTRQGAAGGRLI